MYATYTCDSGYHGTCTSRNIMLPHELITPLTRARGINVACTPLYRLRRHPRLRTNSSAPKLLPCLFCTAVAENNTMGWREQIRYVRRVFVLTCRVRTWTITACKSCSMQHRAHALLSSTAASPSCNLQLSLLPAWTPTHTHHSSPIARSCCTRKKCSSRCRDLWLARRRS